MRTHHHVPLTTESIVSEIYARAKCPLVSHRHRIVAIAVAMFLICITDTVYGQQPTHLATFKDVEVTVEPSAEFKLYRRYGTGLWRSSMTLDGNFERQTDSTTGGKTDQPLLHDLPASFTKVFAGGKSAGIDRHKIQAITDQKVKIQMKDYDVETHGAGVQAYGWLRMYFQRSEAPPPNDPAYFNFTIGVRDPLVAGNAGIDFKVDVAEIQTFTSWGFWTGYKPPVELKLLRDGKTINDIIPVSSGPEARIQLTSNLEDIHGHKIVGQNDLVMVTVTARVWAGVKPTFPSVPEPATWALGLTGLAAVIGTQAWKKRYPKSAV